MRIPGEFYLGRTPESDPSDYCDPETREWAGADMGPRISKHLRTYDPTEERVRAVNKRERSFPRYAAWIWALALGIPIAYLGLLIGDWLLRLFCSPDWVLPGFRWWV